MLRVLSRLVSWFRRQDPNLFRALMWATAGLFLVYLSSAIEGWTGATVSTNWPDLRAAIERGNSEFVVTSTDRVDYFHHRDTDVDRFVRIVDGFLSFLDERFIPIAPDRRFTVFVSRDTFTHLSNAPILFLDDDPASFGTYYHRYDTLGTHARTGPGTVASLLVYPLLREYAGDTPGWARTAIATFFEKSFAFPGADGNLIFRVGYHNPWRIREIGQFETTEIDEVLDGRFSRHQSYLRLVAMFAWRHGHQKHLIDVLQSKDLKGHENYLAAAFDLPMIEVRDLWDNYVSDLAARRSVIADIPVSQVFGSAEDFHRVMDRFAETGRGA